MTTIQQQFAALSDEELERLCEIVDTIALKMRTGTSYSSELYMLGDEFHFPEADLLDPDGLALLADREARNRWLQLRRQGQ